MALDELDGRILALLEANGRESATKLAAKVGLSRSAVQERVARLERDGIIQGYTVRLGASARPPGVEAYLTVKLSGPVCPRVAPQLRDLPEVLRIESLAGEVDMLIRVRAPDLGALSELRERVARIPEVRAVTTAPVLTVHLDRG
ncbi:Lrp/AsnC family transcriptional regulator [Corallococcus llansteffanensis]|uniref:Lrp/AsnC family transcriptional regulator n=1 Tax=Corallococcus llansteffanensis TaxID=2316731 RepID=A0A3A8PE72_9BACT|nr:Lrp/AsnC family transcriptional regulator [Corallococcus llansteffanensis]RKH54687.1 Lrp/AsnC family transcriptional regulator [Corallococcus llansteffanensis]